MITACRLLGWPALSASFGKYVPEFCSFVLPSLNPRLLVHPPVLANYGSLDILLDSVPLWNCLRLLMWVVLRAEGPGEKRKAILSEERCQGLPWCGRKGERSYLH